MKWGLEGVNRMSESLSQKALVKWWSITHKSFGLPLFALYATPNGGARSAITGANLKLEGTRKGVPDLTLCVPRNGFHGLYIELKYGKNKLSSEQSDFIAFLQVQNYQAAVCYDWYAAKQVIEEYLKT